MEVKSLKAAVGGFFGPDYSVTIDFDINKIKYHKKVFLKELDKWDIYEKNICLDQEKYRRLLDTFESLKIKKWKDWYIPDQMIYDGISWQVKLEYSDYEKISYGENAFPVGWKELCKTLEKITGEKFR